VAAGIAFLLSFPLFRMKGFYFLIGSFAAGEAIRLSWNYFTVPFGGPRGVQLIPSPTITLPGMDTIELWDAIPYYFLTLSIVTICLLILYRLEHSRIGLTLNAVHWRDSLAESVGVDTWRYRTLAFVVASFFAGLAGALFVHYLGSVNPNQFDVGIMVYVLVWVIVGGTRTFAGPIIGVTVLSVANEFFRASEEYRPLIYGCILILAIRFMPDGLESLPRRIRAFVERRRAVRSEMGDTGEDSSQAKAVEG
jgi:branched-chain amino acid transport system permease protein